MWMGEDIFGNTLTNVSRYGWVCGGQHTMALYTTASISKDTIAACKCELAVHRAGHLVAGRDISLSRSVQHHLGRWSFFVCSVQVECPVEAPSVVLSLFDSSLPRRSESSSFFSIFLAPNHKPLACLASPVPTERQAGSCSTSHSFDQTIIILIFVLSSNQRKPTYCLSFEHGPGSEIGRACCWSTNS